MANRYWVGGAGTWDASSTANWSLSSGGAAGASAPSASDDAIFDSSSGSGTVSVDTGAVGNSATINNANINVSLLASVTITSQVTLTLGTLTLGSSTLTTNVFSSTNSNARTFAFGTGKLILAGSGTTIWNTNTATNFNPTGSKTVECSYSGSTGTRTLSGGSAGSSSANTVVNFKITAGSDTVGIGTAAGDIDFTGFSGTLTNAARVVFGSITFSSGMTLTAGTLTTTFSSASSKTLKTNGKTIDFSLAVDGVGGTLTLQDDLIQGATRNFTLTNGTFNAGTKNVTIGNLLFGAGTKTLTLGSGTWTCAGTSWDANTNKTNLTVSASTGIISMTSSSSKIFDGGAFTWPTLNQGGSGALTIARSNTFTCITNTVQPATINFTSGTTQTVSSVGLAGTSGNLLTLKASTPGSAATLSDANGINLVSFCSIKDLKAQGGAIWRAPVTNGNADAGGNTGWVFYGSSHGVGIYPTRKNKVI